MYIFRLAPISNDKSKWSDSSTITYISIQDPDDVLSGGWMPSQAYMTGEYATRNQYVMASLKKEIDLKQEAIDKIQENVDGLKDFISNLKDLKDELLTSGEFLSPSEAAGATMSQFMFFL